MPDSINLKTWQSLVANFHTQITTAVRSACHTYHHVPLAQEVEELTEQIIVLLLMDDCHKVQTFDPNKASFNTWLQHVVNHHVSRQLQRNHPSEPLEGELLKTLSYAPTQEKELLRKERLRILKATINKLSQHDQVIARSKLCEVSKEEIAKELSINPASVEREWRVIKTKLGQIVTNGWQSKAKM